MLIRQFLLLLFICSNTFVVVGQHNKKQEQPLFEAVKSHNNLLYVGIDNILRINDTIAADNKCIVKAKHAFISRSDTNNAYFNVIPEEHGSITFEIYYAYEKDTIMIISDALKCIYLPIPYLTINDNVIRNNVIDRRMLNKAHKIGLFITNDIIDIDEWYDVVGFNLGLNFEGSYNMYHNIGNICSRETKTIMSNLHPGSEIIISVSVKSKTNVLIRGRTYKFMVY